MTVEAEPGAPTIYDVARAAGVSIASVSRVLNGRRNPSPEIRDRVQRAATELGYVPDSAARALSVRLKEVVGVVMRRPLSAGSPIPAPVLPAGAGGAWDTAGLLGYDAFADETESLQFHDMLNRGVERAAQRRGFDLLLRSVDITDHDAGRRVLAVARKSDGLILHDGVLEPGQIDEISRQVPIVTLAGIPSPTTANVGSDNVAGMRALARHLLYDHGYTTLGYLSGYSDSPDSQARLQTLKAEAAAAGAVLYSGPQWQGNYYAAGAAVVTERLMASDAAPPCHRVRERPDRARRHVRAAPVRGRRARAGGRHRVRRHPDGPARAAAADDRAAADRRARRDRVRGAVLHGQPRGARRARHLAADPADVPGKLRLPGRRRAARRRHRPVLGPPAAVLSPPA